MAANYVLLERIELNASAASVTFNNIPQSGYTDLKVVISSRVDIASNYYDWLKISFNGSSSLFTYRELEGSGNTAGSYSGSGQLSAFSNAPTSTGNTFSNGEIYIPNYTSSNYKSYSIDSVTENNATTAESTFNAGLWSNIAAITSIGFTPNAGTNILAGSTFSLYGLAAVGTTPVIAPKASGGNITTDGTYWYHTFTSTDAFVPTQNLTCNYLVVAGGGGAGANRAGGGGAGGLLTGTYSATATSYAVTVGARGNGAIIDSSIVATKGSDSSAFGFTASGGGASVYGVPATYNGGSGAGGGPSDQSPGTGVSGQGYAGGAGVGTGSGGSGAGGGGGGQSAAGSAGSGSTIAGNGGAGWTITSTFNYSYALSGMTVLSSGGGGGAPYNSVGGTGGTGAGNGGYGTGSSSNGNGGNATSYGSGGGGGAYGGGYSGGLGGNGYQGIVIIRYTIV
jgi:hypothetical protein